MPVAVFSLAVTELFACGTHVFGETYRMPTRQSLRCSAMGRDRRHRMYARRSTILTAYSAKLEKLNQRKEGNQAADHDGRQPRQHNVRIR